MSEFIYGRRSMLEALKANQRKVKKIWVQDGLSGELVHEVLKLAKDRGVVIEWVRQDQLDKRVKGHHQGMVAEGTPVSFYDLDGFLSQLAPTAPALLVALDEIQDPHNVGAILRSAGFFGISGALVLKWRSAPVGETAARVSSGAIEHVPIMRITNLANSILDLQKANFEVIGADMEGAPLESHAIHPRSVLVFGNEGDGLRKLVRERCDKILSIRGSGKVSSLNVSASAAIFMYEFCRAARSQPT